MKLLNDDTPIEVYKVGKKKVHVKREDLCTPSPGPTFSKVRGLLPKLLELKYLGYKNIGYTESSISMAGWGVAWICSMLDLNCIIFDPQYVSCGQEHLKVLEYHREKWKELNATVLPVKAGMVRVNYHVCSKTLKENYEKSIMLPLGLPFSETISATEEIAEEEAELKNYKSVVTCIGSGTICAGLLKTFSGKSRLYGVMTRSGNVRRKRKVILDKAGMIEEGLLGTKVNFDIIDPGWEYTKSSQAECPFPCHAYYDLKAWQWLTENIDRLETPILFWNIGS